ncbi:ribosomal RNA-processing protein 8 [Thrips palmi]|uniref:Ribosomal RNA-processing protein 8 n=1 Tax=Thrips palmi TaxID=161013 RepID=A0A6P9AEQ9_THRPL|nr:ribosomal RNA-processing protein 8 [Thrips palmi]
MSFFTAPKWDVDEQSENLAQKVFGGIGKSKAKKKRKNELKKQQKKGLNSTPSDLSQTKIKPPKPLGGLLNNVPSKSSKDGLKVKPPGEKISGNQNGSIEQPDGMNGKMSRAKRKKLKKKQQQLSKTSVSEAGTLAMNAPSISPNETKNKKKKKKNNVESAVGSQSKLERLFEVEKKRKKVKKVKEAQGNKPSTTENHTSISPPLSAADKKLKKKLKRQLKKKKKTENLALAKESLNKHEVVLSKKAKKKMLKIAKTVSEGNLEKMHTPQSVQGTANPSLDTSTTSSPDLKEHKNSKKIKKKKSDVPTDSVDGNFVSTFKNYKLGSKLKKSLLPDNGVAEMVPDKLSKRKLAVSKLLKKARVLNSSMSSEEKTRAEAPIMDSTISYDVKKARKLVREGASKGPSSSSPKSKKSKQGPVSLREKMAEQLKSARFRWLNEQLYCSNSWDALKYFKEDPDAYEAYHSGYRNQVAQWPLNPVDVIIQAISKLPSDFVVADFGCGDAQLAASLPDRKVHSLDLVASKPGVIACDMAHTPLLLESVDVAVFCLSLMGTNLNDFILEANRVMKTGGTLYIAEVESRFEDIDNFTSAMGHFGFSLKKKDISNQMFIFMDFKKVRRITKTGKLPDLTLEPCLYKRR